MFVVNTRYLYAVRFNLTFVECNLNSGRGGSAKRLPELRVRIIIWQNSVDPVHLDHKGDLAVIAYFDSVGQLVQMLYAPLCGSVREEPDPALKIRRQSTAFYFRQIFLAMALEIEP